MRSYLPDEAKQNLRKLQKKPIIIEVLSKIIQSQLVDKLVIDIDSVSDIGNIDRATAIEVAKELEKACVGRFIRGRHQSKTRIELRFPVKAIFSSLDESNVNFSNHTADIDQLSISRAKDSEGLDECLSFPFPLRGSFILNLVVPKDLTEDEVDRISDFLRAIPLKR